MRTSTVGGVSFAEKAPRRRMFRGLGGTLSGRTRMKSANPLLDTRVSPHISVCDSIFVSPCARLKARARSWHCFSHWDLRIQPSITPVFMQNSAGTSKASIHNLASEPGTLSTSLTAHCSSAFGPATLNTHRVNAETVFSTPSTSVLCDLPKSETFSASTAAVFHQQTSPQSSQGAHRETRPQSRGPQSCHESSVLACGRGSTFFGMTT